jgi:hypothetical protein
VAGASKYARSLDELEHGVRVPLEEQVTEQPVDSPHDEMEPEDLDRLRLLGITAAGRLNPRR